MMSMARKILGGLLLVPALALAAENVKLERALIDSGDLHSLQRGARAYVNYCQGCHSLGYMRYNRMQDLALSEEQIRDNLIFTGAKTGDLMTNTMNPEEAKQWFGAAPPDLTVIARSRASGAGSGADWLYTYLRGFYRDPARPNGWNNTVYPNVGMPHVLWQLQGEQVLKTETVPGPGRPVTVPTLVLETKGAMTPPEYDRMVADLVNYLDYVAEPARSTRTTMGVYVLLFLGIFWVLAYYLKKEFWKDVH
jgi:ubiquinol-cytochrome c reductase cytochrome c1 subunit